MIVLKITLDFFFNVLKTVFFKYARVVFTERADVKC